MVTGLCGVKKGRKRVRFGMAYVSVTSAHSSRVSMQAGPNHSSTLRPTCVIHVIDTWMIYKRSRYVIYICICTCIRVTHVCGCVFVFSTVGWLVEGPVVRGVPNLIFAWPRVSVPLISRPMVSYREGGTTPIEESSIFAVFSVVHVLSSSQLRTWVTCESRDVQVLFENITHVLSLILGMYS